MNTLFDNETKQFEYKPLAEKMRPTTLEDFFGQEEIVGKKSPIRKMIETDMITSMIFWGPPGVGKTTLAKIIAKQTNSLFYELSAVTSGVKEIKELIEISKFNKNNGKKTIVFVDEIHRFNKSQQDAFLPYVENGNIILIGATTENPSFEVNSALLSRTKVYVLKSLSKNEIICILNRALKENYEYKDVQIDNDCLEIIADISNGDARVSLNTLENVINITPRNKKKIVITKDSLKHSLQSKMFLYDKKGEEHYNLISALHKSMRNSDPDAALYYLARMLEAGENPLYIARRLIRFASEDIGLANPNAIVQATSIYSACHYNVMPECNVNLAQLVVYLSLSPKSNSLYMAYKLVSEDARNTMQEKVPMHLRNAVTKLDSKLGNGEGYKYAHDYENKITNMVCLPNSLKNKKYYKPTTSGHEKQFKEILQKIETIKKSNQSIKKTYVFLIALTITIIKLSI
ncbi:MAG: replication-associated recombination protein A [Bacilli bacterium]|nr:replication-associated recombination protein A [Bacilli bacterium]